MNVCCLRDERSEYMVFYKVAMGKPTMVFVKMEDEVLPNEGKLQSCSRVHLGVSNKSDLVTKRKSIHLCFKNDKIYQGRKTHKYSARRQPPTI